jgi:hypothetical protein
MFVDFVLNGQGHGAVGELLDQGVRFDPGLLRPYIKNRQRMVTVNTGRYRYTNGGQKVEVYAEVPVGRLMEEGIYSPVFNASSLRMNDWIQIDQAVIRAARMRLRAWADLAASSTYGGFNGMAKYTLEYDVMSDPGEAIVDMDGLAEGRTDSPLFKTRSLPLPITHSDFWISARRLAASRNNNTPLDTTLAEAAGRRVAEMIERTVIGIETGMTFGTRTGTYFPHDGTSTVYGYTNLPARITKTNMVVPTGSNPGATLNDILSMRNVMYANKFYGPFMVYHSGDWDQFLDNDYILGGVGTGQSLRDRLRAIDGVTDVRRLDFLAGTYTMIMVQMNPETARAINAMDVTTVQWESQGGMRLNFKVMAIQVPQLRYDINGVAGIIHATTA